MKKCVSCGTMVKDDLDICPNCGYSFIEATYNKKEIKKEDIITKDTKESDLVDYPVLSFVFGIIGLLVPVFIFSFLAVRFAKKPAKENLIPCRTIGKIMGYIGYGMTVIFVILIIILIFEVFVLK